jgi:hypothetical protein
MCEKEGCLAHDPLQARRGYYAWAAKHARRQAAWHRGQARRRPEVAAEQERLAADYEDGAQLFECLLRDLGDNQ